jgi:hypothetical protein
MKCDQIAELEDNYLLGELERAEMEQVEQHLQVCQDCAQRLNGYEEMLGRMFATLEPVSLPAGSRTAVLQQLPPLVYRQPDQNRNKSQAGRWPKPYLWLTGIAAALIIGLSAWALLLWGQLQEVQTRQAEAQRLLEVTGSPDSLVWVMLPPNTTFDAKAPRARMYARPGSELYLVTATNLAPLPTGQVYRVWYKLGDKIEYGGKLLPDSSGQATLKINSAASEANEISSCFVTQEKAEQPNGQPSTPPLLQWKRA